MGYFPLNPRFTLGLLLPSPGVDGLNVDLKCFLRRHQCGDWGDGCTEIHDANDLAVANHDAVLSEYHLVNGSGEPVFLHIMTEADRSFTVLFLAGETLDEDLSD